MILLKVQTVTKPNEARQQVRTGLRTNSLVSNTHEVSLFHGRHEVERREKTNNRTIALMESTLRGKSEELHTN